MIKVNMSDMKSKKEVSEPMILRMQKAAESAAIKYGMLESDFDEFMSRYKPYFLKNGLLTPKDFDDFFSWLCGCRWAESNEPFGAMEIKEFDFKLYHEYEELKLNQSEWNDHQERERLEDRFNPQTPQPIAKQNDKLSDLITHQKSIEIIDAIKIQYKNIKGKRLKLLLLALQELELLPKERIASKFHRLCKIEFDWEIASYNAMNGYNYNEITDVEDFEAMFSFLKELINNK
ncbi:MAG TPA: DUF6043 family protein [Perlabentimonas sp.]|nr:DUF6043 family protein [Perlabentimonas sp.]